jgi:hypothetical protein
VFSSPRRSLAAVPDRHLATPAVLSASPSLSMPHTCQPVKSMVGLDCWRITDLAWRLVAAPPPAPTHEPTTENRDEEPGEPVFEEA